LAVTAAVVRGVTALLCAAADSVDELGKLVAAQIQAVEGITRTLTCPVVNI
jgi:hypothetical protein